ncbi:uncharacterized protein TRAVEDRAFT_26566, partial [Trametes versicolor FP-101664 SS1]|uniref:uncharacterized protein n=1 Tax=Trametes versicolor (strain FP-101664) TaxID=717944 RepID=UPI0004623783
MSGFAPLPVPGFGQVVAPGFSQADNVCYLSPDFLQQGPSGQVMVMGADGTLSTSLSTPGDSPPSYTEGNQFDALNMRCEWVGGPPMAFNDPQRPFPAHLPIAMPGQMVDVDDVLRALELAPSIGAWAASPPGDVDMHLAHLLSSPQSATCYPHGDGSGDDALAQAMNIGDVQEVMDNSSYGASTNGSSFDAALDVNPRSFEDALEFQNTFPDTAGQLMDPNEFYQTQAAEAAVQYPQLAEDLGLNTPTTSFSMDDMGLQWYSNTESMDELFAGVPLESHDASGPSSGAGHSHSGPPTPTQHDAFYGASLPPTPTVDYSAFVSSVSPSPFASSVAPSSFAPTPAPSPFAPTPMSTPVVETADFGSTPVDNTPALQRYVPPGGAGQASRRRVGQRFPRPPFVPGQAQGSGS